MPLIASEVFQLIYTSVFGWFTAFLFIRTHSVYPAIFAHIFCNIMGLPMPVYAVRIRPTHKTSKVNPSSDLNSGTDLWHSNLGNSLLRHHRVRSRIGALDRVSARSAGVPTMHARCGYDAMDGFPVTLCHPQFRSAELMYFQTCYCSQ